MPFLKNQKSPPVYPLKNDLPCGNIGAGNNMIGLAFVGYYRLYETCSSP